MTSPTPLFVSFLRRRSKFIFIIAIVFSSLGALVNIDLFYRMRPLRAQLYLASKKKCIDKYQNDPGKIFKICYSYQDTNREVDNDFSIKKEIIKGNSQKSTLFLEENLSNERLEDRINIESHDLMIPEVILNPPLIESESSKSLLKDKINNQSQDLKTPEIIPNQPLIDLKSNDSSLEGKIIIETQDSSTPDIILKEILPKTNSLNKTIKLDKKKNSGLTNEEPKNKSNIIFLIGGILIWVLLI